MNLERVAFDGPAGRLCARAAGPHEGPVALLLHGFPEFWYGWRKQIGPLAEAGFRVVALDQRGYNESVKPRDVRAYVLDELRQDVVAVIDQLGSGPVFLAGHDWGGIVAWEVAIHHPERLRRLAVLNAPHPAVARRYLQTSPRQMLRSWYMLFFQIPELPETLFSANSFQAGLQSLRRTSEGSAFSDGDLEMYRQAWSHPGAVRSMIHWYRALARSARHAGLADSPVKVPTRILWGMQDRFLLPELARDSLAHCIDGGLVPIAATHWLQHEQPERVNSTLMKWFCTGA